MKFSGIKTVGAMKFIFGGEYPSLYIVIVLSMSIVRNIFVIFFYYFLTDSHCVVVGLQCSCTTLRLSLNWSLQT